MKNLIALFACLILLSCQKSYEPDKNLNVEEQEQLKWRVIRYIAKPPDGLTFQERFYAGYDSYYKEQASNHRLEAFYKGNDKQFFLISRIAPSLVEKRVATGGYFILNGNDSIQQYEEIFRTWKMVPDTLKKRSLLLFDKMVKGENLRPYETRFSNGIDYIEFPDERTYFNKTERTWKVKSEP